MIVLGTNYLEDQDTRSLPAGQHYTEPEIIAYHVLTLFSDTLGVHDLYKSIIHIEENSTMTLDRDMLEENEGMEIRKYFDLYLQDASGQTAVFPVYSSMDYDGIGAEQVIICDVNGDGLMDICTFIGKMYPGFTIFLQTEQSLAAPFVQYFPG